MNSKAFMNGVARFLFPQFCVLCDQRILIDDHRFYCPACWVLPTRIERPFCNQCGQPHNGQVGFGELNNFKCKTCRERGSKDFDSLYATVVYEGAAEDAVKRLKFHRKKPLAKLMGEEMVEFARNEMELEQYELVQAVPLHPIRKRERGYNQAELLAAQLANHCATLQLANSLQRIRPTRVQSRISDPKLRRTNMAGAFAVNPSINLNDKTVLLIDDVVTTGGTVSECAKALKRAGAAKVDVLTFSVPIPDQDVG